MPQNKIVVVGAREHNLQNITVEIPRDKLVVITGLSGSGKSSLAFDTIFAEGQRRYVESLSAYARQFLGQLEKPDVDHIDGLSPAVSIDQKGVSKNPRSTVGTVTEVYDYLRLLFARVGTPHCPECGREVSQQSAQGIVDAVSALKEGTRIMLLAPLIKDRKGHHQTVFEGVRKSGFARVRVDGAVLDVNDALPELDRYKLHTIEAVVDRLIVRNGKGDAQKEFATRLTDSVETSLRLGQGLMLVHQMDTREDLLFSEHFACPLCGISLPELEPRSFSFNSPHGACTECQGLGHKLEIDPELVIPDQSRSIGEGAIEVMEWRNSHDEGGYYWQTLEAAAKHAGIGMDIPIASITAEQRRLLLYGSNAEKISIQYKTRDGRNAVWNTEYEGVIPNLERRYRESTSDFVRQKIEGYMSQRDCEACGGLRLRREVLAVKIDGRNIVEVTGWPVTRVLGWSAELAKSVLNKRQKTIARQVLKEISARLQFMVDVGLDYLTLSRTAASLSGGEAQRIRLATQIGSQLMGVLYVLDEPSIGLHQRDNARLLKTLQAMRDLGNTLLVVEHDDETMRAADWILDLGPGAGAKGGRVVAEGTLATILKHPTSITGAYLSGRMAVPVPAQRRPGSGKAVVVRNATANNLKNITVSIPLGKMVCITGVSGSGKSTLLNDIVYRTAASLSGGEAQRIRLATQIGSQLMGVLYVLDEPSIGLHQRDNARLLKTLQAMRDLGNTLLVVEHDDETMRAADWILDLGPGAGAKGGRVVAEGTLATILKHPTSITGAYLSGRMAVPVPAQRRPGSGKAIVVRNATANNLKNITVSIPLGKMVCITGVSGSGKSTLLNDIVYRAAARALNGAGGQAGAHGEITGLEHLDKVINIDQSPIGRTPRSNPATYVGLFDEIRKLYAELPESKVRGYKQGRYSFNVKGGRCETCQGQGQLQIEMQFLPDIYVPCDDCQGSRYNRETLQVRFKEHSIADVLGLSVDEALVLFTAVPIMRRKLETLQAVGLGYVKVGQSATTLSGGEAQRIKLSKELSRRSTGRTMYVLDEPSVGLHAADVHRLIEVLQKFADQGNSVLIIEHNMDIIKTADHLIDLGPEGGDRGGELLAEGTPEQVARVRASYTGQYLKKHLAQARA